MTKKKLAREISEEVDNKHLQQTLNPEDNMSGSDLFKPIIGEWSINTNAFNQLEGDVCIKCFPLMGYTLLHPLRRVVLGFSSAYGLAAVKITNNNESPLHIFGSITGIVEDVPYIHANIKAIKIKVIKSEIEQEVSDLSYFFLTLNTNKAGPVYARDIKIDLDENSETKIEIVNPDHVICNLDVGSNLKIEMLFRRGFGYASEEENQKQLSKLLPSALREGWFYVGTQFSKGVVSFVGKVTEMTGGSIAYDLLEIKIITDGRIQPQEALHEAFKILHGQIPFSFSDNDNNNKEGDNRDSEGQDTPLKNIHLQPGTLNQLERNGVFTLKDLLKHTGQSLKSLRGFGSTRLQDVIETLGKLNLYLQD
jgi:DNA-directed RNA polymerase subunit alpha